MDQGTHHVGLEFIFGIGFPLVIAMMIQHHLNFMNLFRGDV
jgi:hypothetical protein